jgi:hypothetical protein
VSFDFSRPFQSLFNPKTANRFYVKDFKNAERLRIDTNPPRQRFQGYVNFVFNRSLLDAINDGQEFRAQISSLVRTADLPSVSFKTETKNQYNRKKIVHTGVDFTSVNIKVLDTVGNEWLTILMKYYAYLYTNPRNRFKSQNRDALDWATQPERSTTEFKYSQTGGFTNPGPFDSASHGFDLRQFANFFERIDMVIYHGNRAVQYSLQNPVLTAFKSGQIDYSSGEFLEFDLSFDYENFVVYDKLNFQMGKSDLARFDKVDGLPLWVGNKPLSISDAAGVGAPLDLAFLGEGGSTSKRLGRTGQPQTVDLSSVPRPTYQPLTAKYNLNPAPAQSNFLKDTLFSVIDRSIATAIHGGDVKKVATQVATASVIKGITNAGGLSGIIARTRGG